MSTTTVTQINPVETAKTGASIKEPPHAHTTGSAPPSIRLQTFGIESDGQILNDGEPEAQSPHPTFRVQESWNNPRSNILKTISCFWSLLVVGMNDGSYGALIPSIQSYYGLNYIKVSLIFVIPFVGYSIAAVFCDKIHTWSGRRGAAFFASIPRLVCFIAIACHPPYPVVCVLLVLNGLGNGISDSAWNAVIGNLANANELLGFLHGFYGLGATIAPLIITSLVQTYGRGWYTYYYVLIGAVALEFALTVVAFWKETGLDFRRQKASAGGDEQASGARAAAKQKVTWVCSAFLLTYVGTEVSLGSWIVVFMLNVRHGAAFASGLTATGFWLGITVGRVVLGFITPRIGEKVAVSIYLLLAMGLELIFWLVPQFIVSAVAVGLLGFFMGPLFPASIIATTKILPPRLHVSSIGISASIGGGGAAL